MPTLLLVALGGAFGAVCRYLLGVRMFKAFGPGLPYGTFATNVLGGLLMGVLVGVLALRGGGDQERWRLLLGSAANEAGPRLSASDQAGKDLAGESAGQSFGLRCGTGP